jgi:5-hydroxyisourate hydrolase
VSHLTTHVLDITHGRPATGIAVTLADAAGTVVGTGTTDADGRIADLGPDRLAPGEWTLSFATGAYWAALGTAAFHPRVTVVLTVPEDAVPEDAVPQGGTDPEGSVPEDTADAGRPGAHLHVPLLLSPFAYSTYRGS